MKGATAFYKVTTCEIDTVNHTFRRKHSTALMRVEDADVDNEPKVYQPKLFEDSEEPTIDDLIEDLYGASQTNQLEVSDDAKTSKQINDSDEFGPEEIPF